MAALVCDICGGKLKVTNGKYAVCESCGMEHSIERVRQKYKESQSVVHVDNAHLIDNYLVMAQDAYDAGNKKEAERYCNKIIEIDPENVDALMLKGKTVGWQSSIGEFRFKEASICFANAINSIASDSEKEYLVKQIEDEFRGLATALINLRCDRFSKWPDDDETEGFCDDLEELSNAVETFTVDTGEFINKNNVFRNVSSIVKMTIGTVATTKILLEYKVNGSRQAYLTFSNRTDNCIRILEKAADLCDDDDESDEKLYDIIISMLRSVISNNTTDYISDRFGAFKEKPRLSDFEIETRKKKISFLEDKIKKINSK